MSTKGTASKSATSASISKYDVEVESRLKALEEKLQSPEGEIVSTVEERIAVIEKRLDDLIYKLSIKMTL